MANKAMSSGVLACLTGHRRLFRQGEKRERSRTLNKACKCKYCHLTTVAMSCVVLAPSCPCQHTHTESHCNFLHAQYSGRGDAHLPRSSCCHLIAHKYCFNNSTIFLWLRCSCCSYFCCCCCCCCCTRWLFNMQLSCLMCHMAKHPLSLSL